jgi:hypothetical protein
LFNAIFTSPLDAPHALQRSLETIGKLDEQLRAVGEAVDEAISDLQARHRTARENSQIDGRSRRRVAIQTKKEAEESQLLLNRMDAAKETFQTQIDTLYISLELPPELEALGDVDRTFLHMLIQCSQVKTVIRQKALGTLFEMDRLEQAVGGASNPLGENGDAMGYHSLMMPRH